MVILDYAPVILDARSNITRVGGVLLWSFYTLGCAVGAGPVSRCGTRRALLAGLCLFDAFNVLFAACAWLGPCAAQWPIFLAGMPLVGFGAAIVFTAICVYMTGVGAILAEESPLETESEMLANLGGSLGAWSLGTELAYKLATSSLQALEFPTEAILVAWLAVALACTTLMTATRDLPVNEDEDRDPALAPGAAGAIAAFFALWRDPCTWLLGFTTYTYAFSDALIVNTLDPAYVAPMLGTQAIGIVTATTSLSGLLLAKPYGFSWRRASGACPRWPRAPASRGRAGPSCSFSSSRAAAARPPRA